jgi:hypothetical protein
MPAVFRFQSTLVALKTDLAQLVRQRDELQNQISAIQQTIRGLLMLRDAAVADDGEARGDPSWVATAMLAKSSISADEVADAMRIPEIIPPPAKLTDLCRSAVKASGKAMSATEVKTEVELRGFDFSQYQSNPLSSLHTVLRRIPGIAHQRIDGKSLYEWKNE